MALALLMASCLSSPDSTAGPVAGAEPSTAAPEPTAASGPAVEPAPVAEAPCAALSGTEPNFVQLTDVQVTNQGNYDQIVFTFDPQGIPGGPQSWEVKETSGPFQQDPSDDPLPVAGTVFFEVTFKGASGVDLSGSTFVQTYTGPTRFTPNYPTLAETAQRTDFERELSWVAGLSQSRCPTAAVMASSALVVDFPH